MPASLVEFRWLGARIPSQVLRLQCLRLGIRYPGQGGWAQGDPVRTRKPL